MLIASVARLFTFGIQIDLLKNCSGNFGISGRSTVNERDYHVWVIAGANIYSSSQENSSTINTTYVIALNFSSATTIPCEEQYVYVYKQSEGLFSTSTLLIATFTGADLQSENLLIKSSVVTVVYHYYGQHNPIGFNATYFIKPLLNTTVMVS